MLTSGAVNFFLMQLLLIAVVLILHTYIGLHVIRRTLIFSDLALDQLAALGILLCIVVNSNEETGNLVQLNDPITYIYALGAVTFGSFLLAVIKPKSKNIPREAVIGIMFAISLLACFAITDPVNGDFQLQKDSPAIDKGLDVGLSYSGSAPDMGAYEFGTSGGGNSLVFLPLIAKLW